MNASAPSSLSPDALARRLAELVADERGALVEFLLHLEEFDRRRAWAEAGYDSLWTYCQRVLYLREGPAGRRIAAMRIVRRFPRLADALRDGRLCLSTVTLLAPLLSDDTFEDVVAKAAYETKAEVEHLVASLLPREAPREGIRRLPERQASGESAADVDPADGAARTSSLPPLDGRVPPPSEVAVEPALPLGSGPPGTASCGAPLDPRRSSSRATLTPVAADVFSLRVTVDAALKAEWDELTCLLSHKVPNGDVAAVLREAVHCALEKHGRRKGARAPEREQARGRASTPPTLPIASPAKRRRRPSTEPARHPPRRPHVPAHVRREVWKRDGGVCTWFGPDGHRCESRWQLEFDHIDPVALVPGRVPAADDLRLRCRVHNQLYAEEVFGAEHMARFRRRRRDAPGRVKLLIPG